MMEFEFIASFMLLIIFFLFGMVVATILFDHTGKSNSSVGMLYVEPSENGTPEIYAVFSEDITSLNLKNYDTISMQVYFLSDAKKSVPLMKS